MSGDGGLKSHSEHPVDFLEARIKELDGLMSAGLFNVVDRRSVPDTARIYGTRWVDVVKGDNGARVLKSRLVAQNFRDNPLSKFLQKHQSFL